MNPELPMADPLAGPARPGLPHAGRQAAGRIQSALVGAYWNRHVHDLEIATQPVGTPAFFRELESYRFEKLAYLADLIASAAQPGRRMLEVGCGVGIDLARFAGAGARVAGIDLSSVAINLARRNLAQQQVQAELGVMDGETLAFESGSFDLVYAHGVLPYTPDAAQMVREIHRVLRPGGETIVMVYNRHSWLNALSRLTRVKLEHADAPVMHTHSMADFRRLLRPFARVRIVAERFPVATKLHRGLKASLYNTLFVQAFNRLPKALTRPLGWHLVAHAVK